MLVNYSGREINAKLVYYGPGLSGKTTNLEYIYSAIPQTHRGKMVSMKTKTERTLFFDFLPIHLGELSGFRTRFLLYTVPGQVYYNATRKLVLKGVDAVVFVADSERGKMDENIESLQNLRTNLEEHGLSLDRIPWIIQYNKRDLPDVYSVEELERVLNPRRIPSFEAVATSGDGVFDSFKAIARMLLKHLSSEIGVQVVADSTSPAIGEPGSPEAGATDSAPTPQSISLEPAPSPQGEEVEPAAASHPTPSEPISSPEARSLESQPEAWADKSAEPAEEAAADPSAQDRPEGVGVRLRRWLAGSQPPEERPDAEITPESPTPAAESAPSEPAAPPSDGTGESVIEALLAPDPPKPAEPVNPPEPEPAREEVPVSESKPVREPEAPAEAPRRAALEIERKPAIVPGPPSPESLTMDTEPQPETEPAMDVSLSVPPKPSVPVAEDGQDGHPGSRFREVPILVDLEPEDLEAGVVLKLRIAVRQHASRREGLHRSWQDRAA